MNILIINCSPVRNGATAEIAKTAEECLAAGNDVRNVCIDDFDIHFCKGCRACHKTAKCVQNDDTDKLIELFEWADKIVCVSPSYWADVPGQFKVFIDRCTPWCNTHEPHASLKSGKRGYAIVLRTGPNIKECERLTATIAHFFGHMEISYGFSLKLCSVENKADVEPRKNEIVDFCKNIIMA